MLKVKYDMFGSLAANNYLLTDTESGESALVDCSSDRFDMMHFIGSADLKYILLTHGHFDHTDGVCRVAEETGAKIVIAEADKRMATDTHLNVADLFAASDRDYRFVPYTPHITVKDGDTLPLGNEEIRVMATPGHTPGCVCYIAGDHLFTGDTIMVGGYGRTDFPGGDFDELVKSLSKLNRTKSDYHMYPGHGEILLNRRKKG